MPAVPNMVKECISNKVSPVKKWLTKAILDRNKIKMEWLLILEFLMKQ